MTCSHNTNISCSDCRLSTVCLPLGLTPAQMVQVDDLIQHRPLLQKKSYLYHAGDAFEHLYVVRSGCVKTVMGTESGEEKITGFYLSGDIVGIEGISDQRYHSSAVALDTSSLCKIPFTEIEQLATTVHDLQRHMFTIMSKEIVTDQHAMMIMNKKKADARIAAFLLSLSGRFQRQHQSPFQWILPMSRGELGNYLGLTIETVSRVFTKLQKANIISINKRELEITSLKELQHIADLSTNDN
ncbi:fumarate/nitrate reduction transcriptional regulator Fnr [Eionea flava]